MALMCKRLLSPGKLGGFSRALYTSQIQNVTMKSVGVAPLPNESHDKKNLRLGRPHSPHLTIYKYQLTSMMSISHRMTGMALSAYVGALGIGALVLPNEYPHYLTMIEDMHLHPALIGAVKFLIAFPLCYHYANGIRHLLWDMGKNLSLKQVYSTGYVTLVLAIASTAVLVAL